MVHVVRIPCKSQKFFINLLYACKFKSPVGLIFDDGRAGVQDFRQSHCDVITTTCPSKKKKKRTVFPGLFALVLLSAWVCGDIGCFFFCLERESVREEKEGFGALVGLARRKSTDSLFRLPETIAVSRLSLHHISDCRSLSPTVAVFKDLYSIVVRTTRPGSNSL